MLSIFSGELIRILLDGLSALTVGGFPQNDCSFDNSDRKLSTSVKKQKITNYFSVVLKKFFKE